MSKEINALSIILSPCLSDTLFRSFFVLALLPCQDRLGHWYHPRRFGSVVYCFGSLLSLTRRVEAGQQASAGLLYLHEQTPPIVHRDIKPENFLVGPAGEIKVWCVCVLCGV